MEEKDLRIGNYVKYKGKIIMVESISEYGINLSANYGGFLESDYSIGSLDGIELAPEILEKAGFSKKHKSEYYTKYQLDKNKFWVAICKTDTAMHNKGDIIAWPSETTVKYLHQLQN